MPPSAALNDAKSRLITGLRTTDWWRPNLTYPQTGYILAIWIGMQMNSQSPLENPYVALFIIGVAFWIVLTRNVALIAGVTLAVNIALRLAYPISSWADQHWAQWYCISSLATGNNIEARSPLAGMSMAAYLPQGDLFGGLFIALGIQKYWYVWQFINPLLYALPVAMAPCGPTLAVFIAMSWYWPLADYTNAGGNLEVNLAVLIAAVAAYRHNRKTVAIILFAFAAMMRQPSIAIVPFLFLLLWQEGDWARMKLFAALLFLFGGVYMLLDPVGAYIYQFRFYDQFQQSFFNDRGGLAANITISSIPRAFGIPDEIPWNKWKGIYLPLTLVGILGLLGAAWKSKKRDSILFFALLGPAFVYVLARGYAQLHYIVAAFFPLFSMVAPASAQKHTFERYFANAMALILLWVGLAPLAIFIPAKAVATARKVVNRLALPVSRTEIVNPDGTLIPVSNLDGDDSHREVLALNQAIEFDFDQPFTPDSMRLTGDHVQIQRVKNIDIWWATDTQSRGSIWTGSVEYSTDGNHFQPPVQFENRFTYEAFPVTINLPKPAQPTRALRLRARELYLRHPQWVLGNVEFFGSK